MYPTGACAETELVVKYDDPKADKLSVDHQRALDSIIARLYRKRDGQHPAILRICCWNSTTREHLLTVPELQKIDRKWSRAVFSKLRNDIDKVNEKHSEYPQIPWLPHFTEKKESFEIRFRKNPSYAGIIDPVFPEINVERSRFVTIPELRKLETLETEGAGGHLRPGSKLIVQGDIPLLANAEIADVVLSNLKKGIRYQFVFPHNSIEPARAIGRLFKLETTPDADLKQHLRQIGQNLEIHCSEKLWPFVVSVHNASEPERAVCFHRIPDTECLVELFRGKPAFDVGRQIADSVIGHVEDQVWNAWFRTPVDKAFQKEFLQDLETKRGKVFPKPLYRELRQRLFGTSD